MNILMNRRKFLKSVGAGATAAALPFGINSCGLSRKRPNILYIMTDDHAAQAISCYGSRVNSTPNIDRIANDGIRFANSFCTNSICAPSRAVLLTGKYSHLNGVVDNTLEFDGSQQTFPKLLQHAGYETAMIGKWHLKSDPTGFDYWNVLPGQGYYYNPDFIEMGERKNFEGYATDLITDFSLNWLKNRNNERPFCMLLHHKAPHRNWMPDDRHLTMYDDETIYMPETFFDDYKTRSDAAREQKMSIADDMYMSWDLKIPAEGENIKSIDRSYNRRLERLTEEQLKTWNNIYNPKNETFKKANLTGKELAEWKYQRYIKDYLRCIASVDDNVGRVLDYLDEAGLADDTIVVYTSDQGFYLGEHGWFDKRFMYEESLRMPLLVRYPSEVRKGIVNENLVLNLDFAPTFLDFAGVEIPEDMQGESLKPLLKGKSHAGWRKSIYYHYYEYPAVHSVKRHYGIRTERYKLIHFYYDIDAWELYDLRKDPNELNNVYENPDYSEIVTELKSELEKLREKYGDTETNKYLPRPPEKVEHKAVGCDVQLKYQYSESYTGGGKNALTDGIKSADVPGYLPDTKCWQGFRENDLQATVNLGKSVRVNKISAGFLHNIERWIFLPKSVSFAISADGKRFQQIKTMSNPISPKEKDVLRHEFSAEFEPVSARYVRVTAENIRECPEWHRGAGRKTWLFADEIIVE